MSMFSVLAGPISSKFNQQCHVNSSHTEWRWSTWLYCYSMYQPWCQYDFTIESDKNKQNQTKRQKKVQSFSLCCMTSTTVLISEHHQSCRTASPWNVTQSGPVRYVISSTFSDHISTNHNHSTLQLLNQTKSRTSLMAPLWPKKDAKKSMLLLCYENHTLKISMTCKTMSLMKTGLSMHNFKAATSRINTYYSSSYVEKLSNGLTKHWLPNMHGPNWTSLLSTDAKLSVPQPKHCLQRTKGLLSSENVPRKMTVLPWFGGNWQVIPHCYWY